MAHDVEISKVNEVYIRVSCQRDIAKEISDHFTFLVPGHTFVPAYRKKLWDCKIRLFNVMNHLLYYGLLEHLCKFLYLRNYKAKFVDDSKTELVILTHEDLPKLPVEIRDYQLNAINHALTNHRSLLLSPTASGKSLIIYILVRYLKLKTLILVPTTSLVSQMYNDFREYGWDVANNCHTVFAGRDKGSELPVIISTWQSIYKMQQKYFEQYELVIGDEAHGFKSKSLTAIMTKCINAKYRIGTTGTLDGTQTHKLVLEGLLGKVHKVTTTKKLIDQKHLSPFTINTLLLFRFVEKHGQLLYDMIKENTNDRKIFFVYGGTDTDTREQIRAIVESERNAVIVASYGVFSVGVNIRNLHNIIFATSVIKDPDFFCKIN